MINLMILTQDIIDEYHENGIVVIENVLSDEEVAIARDSLHYQLLSMDIDHDKVLSGEQILTDGVRIKGRPSNIFYNKWKMDVHLHENVYSCMKQLMQHTYFTGRKQGYEHPFGTFDDILPFIDRICWRLPDVVKQEGGLSMHLDRNPHDPYLMKKTGTPNLKKWRPIQAFLSLTDQYGSNSGGLKVVKKFHHEIDNYFSKNKTDIESNGGEFYRFNLNTHASLHKRLVPIDAPRGSLVCWDNRLPHATCQFLDGYDTREVVYIGWLPNVPLNINYWQKQLANIKLNIPPPIYFSNDNQISDVNWTKDDLTKKQKKLLGF